MLHFSGEAAPARLHLSGRPRQVLLRCGCRVVICLPEASPDKTISSKIWTASSPSRIRNLISANFLCAMRAENYSPPAIGTWPPAKKISRSAAGLDPAKLLANDSRFPWAKELAFDAPPEIELSGMARPDGRLQVLGNLNFDQFSFRNVKFQSMKAEFSKSGDSWMVMNAQVTHRSGTLSGDILNRPGDFRMRINSALNPTELMPLCPPRFQHALTDWEFQTSPVIQATFSGATPEFAKMSGSGQIWLGKTKFRGALVNSASADCELRNNVLRCDQVRVIRDEGTGTGRFTCDFGQEQADDRRCRSRTSLQMWWQLGSIRRSEESCSHSVLRSLQPFTLREQSGSAMDPPTIFESGSMRQNPFAYQFGGWEIPFQQGSGDFSMLGGEPAEFRRPMGQ